MPGGRVTKCNRYLRAYPPSNRRLEKISILCRGGEVAALPEIPEIAHRQGVGRPCGSGLLLPMRIFIDKEHLWLHLTLRVLEF